MKFVPNKKKHNGNIMLIITLFVTLVGTSAILSSSQNTARNFRDTQNTIRTRQSYSAAESSLEDVIYRLKNGMNYGETETLSVGDSFATTDITSLLGGGFNISSLGNFINNSRLVNVKLTEDVGVAFNYGLQVGRGGLSLSGSSGIKGNVYANGNINGTGSSTYITGSAIAANSSALGADQTNGTTGTPSNTIIFGNNNATQDVAQSFQLSGESPLNKISLYIKKTGNPSNATVRIRTDNSGSPSTTYLATGTLTASLVTTNYGWVDVVFTTNPTLSSGTTYWIVVDSGTSASNYYTIAANSAGYANGQAKIGTSTGVWSNTSPTGLDTYFSVYLGGLVSSISGPSQWDRLQIGTSGSGIAHAQIVNNTSATGTIYCMTGSGNNKSCDASLGIPTEQPWPVSDSNIEAWQAEALAGGTTNGNVSVGGSSTSSIGPKKIVGDLTVNGSGTLDVTGTLWVTGNINISGSGKLRLHSSYGTNSGIIVSDGRITIGGSSPVTGSGTNGSYILMVSLSDCPTSSSCSNANAIDISGSAGAVVLVAQNGTINFSGSAKAKQATGYKINLSGSTTVEYESGLANLNFTSGPSGSWDIESWKEGD